MRYFEMSCLTEVWLRGFRPPSEQEFLNWIWSNKKLARAAAQYESTSPVPPFGLSNEHRGLLFDELSKRYVGEPWPEEGASPEQFRTFAKAFIHCLRENGWTALDMGTT